MTPLIQPDSRILFQGDSITDAGRDRNNPDSLGNGYAFIAAAWFSALYSQLHPVFINRGISGNRSRDLPPRWQTDCLALKPDWLSIMIGINDTWRRFDRNDPTSAVAYEADLRLCLHQARDKTGCRLILIEPFVLPHPEDRKQWREDLQPRIEIVNRLADEFEAILVPLDRIMNDAAAKNGNPAYWAHDGVHPTPAGHALIAQAWLKAIAALSLNLN